MGHNIDNDKPDCGCGGKTNSPPTIRSGVRIAEGDELSRAAAQCQLAIEEAGTNHGPERRQVDSLMSQWRRLLG